MRKIRCKNWNFNEGEEISFEIMEWATILKKGNTTYFYNSKGELLFETDKTAKTKIVNNILAISVEANVHYFNENGEIAYNTENTADLKKQGLYLKKTIGVRRKGLKSEFRIFGVVSMDESDDADIGLYDFEAKRIVIPCLFKNIDSLEAGYWDEERQDIRENSNNFDSNPDTRPKYWVALKGKMTIVFSFDGKKYYLLKNDEHLYSIGFGYFITQTDDKYYHIYSEEFYRVNGDRETYKVSFINDPKPAIYTAYRFENRYNRESTYEAK